MLELKDICFNVRQDSKEKEIVLYEGSISAFGGVFFTQQVE